MNEAINFVESRWQYLSPFSAHEVEVGGVVYKTAEHAYQTLRMLPEFQESVKETKSPLAAWRVAQELKKQDKLDKNVSKDILMEIVFRAKLEQHQDIIDVLIESKDRELLKVYDTDYYWGTGADGSGQNKMGKLWMKLRDELN